MEHQRDDFVEIRRLAIELNNVAMQFHDWGDFGIAGAILSDALNAMHFHFDTNLNQREKQVASQKYKKILRQRKSLAYIYDSFDVICSGEGTEEIQQNFDVPVKAIFIEASLANSDALVVSSFFYNIGLVRFFMGQLDASIGCLMKASTWLAPTQKNSHMYLTTFMSIHCLLGLTFLHQDKLDESMREFTMVIHTGSSAYSTEHCNRLRMAVLDLLEIPYVSTGCDNPCMANEVVHKSTHQESRDPLEDTTASPAA